MILHLVYSMNFQYKLLLRIIHSGLSLLACLLNVPRHLASIILLSHMEIISFTHHCLHFKFNKRRYFFGLTHALANDASALRKLKTDLLILPSFPYSADQSLFFWHLEALTSLACQNILVSDFSVRKRVEPLITGVGSVTASAYKWETLKQHELTEQQLMKVYEECRVKAQPLPIRYEPNGLGFNGPADQLNVIVSENGRSLILVHQGDTLLIDPPERIQASLQYYGLPLDSVKGVILTRPGSNSVFQLFFKSQSVSVITTDTIYCDLRKQIKTYFHWDDAMIRQKVRGKVLTQQAKPCRYRSLDISFKENLLRSLEYLDIVFGMRRIRIYPQELQHFPSELLELKDMELLVLSEMEASLKKELECCPEAYRKKIVYNRVSRKYNNKYFYTIGGPSEFIAVKAHHYKSEQLRDAVQDLSFLYKEKDPNYRLACKDLQPQEKFNASERVVYVRKGYVQDEQGRLHGPNARVSGVKDLTGVSNALLMHEPTRNVYFNQGSRTIDPHNILATEDLLKRVKDNSFLKSLKKRVGAELEGSEEVEMGSEWEVLNSICVLKTLEGGLDLGKSSALYFVVKGCMKYRDTETLATKNMGIGSVRKFYSSSYDESEETEVVKDSWAIEIGLKELHCKFFTRFPARMYELLVRPGIFE